MPKISQLPRVTTAEVNDNEFLILNTIDYTGQDVTRRISVDDLMTAVVREKISGNFAPINDGNGTVELPSNLVYYKDNAQGLMLKDEYNGTLKSLNNMASYDENYGLYAGTVQNTILSNGTIDIVNSWVLNGIPMPSDMVTYSSRAGLTAETDTNDVLQQIVYADESDNLHIGSPTGQSVDIDTSIPNNVVYSWRSSQDENLGGGDGYYLGTADGSMIDGYMVYVDNATSPSSVFTGGGASIISDLSTFGDMLSNYVNNGYSFNNNEENGNNNNEENIPSNVVTYDDTSYISGPNTNIPKLTVNDLNISDYMVFVDNAGSPGSNLYAGAYGYLGHVTSSTIACVDTTGGTPQLYYYDYNQGDNVTINISNNNDNNNNDNDNIPLYIRHCGWDDILSYTDSNGEIKDLITVWDFEHLLCFPKESDYSRSHFAGAEIDEYGEVSEYDVPNEFTIDAIWDILGIKIYTSDSYDSVHFDTTNTNLTIYANDIVYYHNSEFRIGNPDWNDNTLFTMSELSDTINKTLQYHSDGEGWQIGYGRLGDDYQAMYSLGGAVAEGVIEAIDNCASYQDTLGSAIASVVANSSTFQDYLEDYVDTKIAAYMESYIYTDSFQSYLYNYIESYMSNYQGGNGNDDVIYADPVDPEVPEIEQDL